MCIPPYSERGDTMFFLRLGLVNAWRNL